MITYKLEHGVPLPVEDGKERSKVYPWHEMKVGDSFFISVKSELELAKVQTNISVGATGQKRAHGTQFTARKIRDEKGNPVGVRCWRVK